MSSLKVNLVIYDRSIKRIRIRSELFKLELFLDDIDEYEDSIRRYLKE